MVKPTTGGSSNTPLEINPSHYILYILSTSKRKGEVHVALLQ